jgi:ATP-dependent Lon protease
MMLEELMLQQPVTDDEPEFLPLFSLEDEDENKIDEQYPDILPVLILKNTILFPGTVIPITVGRNKSIQAINKAYETDRIIAVVAQEDSKVENATEADIYRIGTIARIVKLLKMPDGSLTAIIQGRRRFEIEQVVSEEPFMQARVRVLAYEKPHDKLQFDAMIVSVRDLAKQIIDLHPSMPNEASVMLQNISNDGFLLSFVASNLGIKIQIKQQILAINNVQDKAEKILEQLNSELQLLEVKEQIEARVRGEMEKQQRDYILNQQLKTIQDELGGSPHEEDINRLAARAVEKKWSEKVAKAFDKEIAKLRRINPQMPDYSTQFNYLEILLELPWEDYSKDNFDLKKVKKVLDDDHFGLEKVKERILEHLAVLKLKGDMKAPILCLYGPPGVGKTSLGNSIARALNRKYIRVSLGGLHDESEIRGHRRTYIGAMPGRIIQNMRKAGTGNPVFILDEIDKLGRDHRGDPSSALLEVLDPEQNTTFHDNFLDIEYDLSKVLFIATANSLNTIQPALLDRMEIIDISGYSLEEKLKIAERHLIPNQIKEHGLKPKDIAISTAALQQIIQKYTRESGVRSLNRQIGSITRYVAKRVAMKEAYPTTIEPEHLYAALGPINYTHDLYEDTQTPGVVVGLAWTSVGGDILFIETNIYKGSGKLTLTGNLGTVMQESATTALSFLRANHDWIGIEDDIFEKKNIHIHVPEGATPKDGPSAGIAMLTTLASAILNKPVKAHLAMTGEITLRGKVLPVGGIKEKVLAAKRAGIKEIILCKENEKDVKEITQAYVQDITFHYVAKMKEVLEIALGV